MAFGCQELELDDGHESCETGDEDYLSLEDIEDPASIHGEILGHVA